MLKLDYLRFDLASESIKKLQAAGLKQEAYLMRRWRDFSAQRIALSELLEEVCPSLSFPFLPLEDFVLIELFS